MALDCHDQELKVGDVVLVRAVVRAESEDGKRLNIEVIPYDQAKTGTPLPPQLNCPASWTEKGSDFEQRRSVVSEAAEKGFRG